MNLLAQAKIRMALVSSASATGTNATSELDMAGFEGVVFVGGFETIAAGGSVGFKAQQSQTSGSDFDDLEGTNVAVTVAQDDYTFLLDVYKPESRYVRGMVVGQSTATPYTEVFAIQYGARKMGVLNTTSGSTEALAASGVVSEIHITPGEGTA